MTTPLDLLLDTEGTQGVNMPLAADAGRIAVANTAGDNLEYRDAADVIPADGTVAAALAPHLASDFLVVNSSDELEPQPRLKRFLFRDHFGSGGSTSGLIGQNGWKLFGSGTPGASLSGGNFGGSARMNLFTSSAAGNHAVTSMSPNATHGLVTVSGELSRWQCVADLGGDLTNKRVFLGFQDNLDLAPGSDTDAIGFIYDSAVSGNWYRISRSASSGSATDTGVAATASGTLLFTVQRVANGDVLMYIGATLVATIPAANVPSATICAPAFKVRTLTTAARGISCKSSLYEVSVGGAYDDDTFLDV